MTNMISLRYNSSCLRLLHGRRAGHSLPLSVFVSGCRFMWLLRESCLISISVGPLPFFFQDWEPAETLGKMMYWSGSRCTVALLLWEPHTYSFRFQHRLRQGALLYLVFKYFSLGSHLVLLRFLNWKPITDNKKRKIESREFYSHWGHTKR